MEICILRGFHLHVRIEITQNTGLCEQRVSGSMPASVIHYTCHKSELVWFSLPARWFHVYGNYNKIVKNLDKRKTMTDLEAKKKNASVLQFQFQSLQYCHSEIWFECDPSRLFRYIRIIILSHGKMDFTLHHLS